jgi:hypothetical protein
MRVVLASEPGTPGWPNEDFAAVAPGAAVLIGQVRAAEDSDPDCIRWPRSKDRDDATIIYWHQPMA